MEIKIDSSYVIAYKIINVKIDIFDIQLKTQQYLDYDETTEEQLYDIIYRNSYVDDVIHHEKHVTFKMRIDSNQHFCLRVPKTEENFKWFAEHNIDLENAENYKIDDFKKLSIEFIKRYIQY